jgi:hypothetical protein
VKMQKGNVAWTELRETGGVRLLVGFIRSSSSWARRVLVVI